MEPRKLELLVRKSETTVMGRCAFQRDEVDMMADRLRSWALIIGAKINGAPFIRICGADDVQVHLPVNGALPHGEENLSADQMEAGPVAAIADVAFDEVRELVASAPDWYPGFDEHRWAEFHPAGRTFGQGTVILPRREVRACRTPMTASPVALPNVQQPREHTVGVP